MPRPLPLVALLPVLMLACCLLAAAVQARDIDTAEARRLLEHPPAGLVVLDVRTPEEFAAGHLPGARNLDFFAPDFRQRLEALALEKRPVLLYCRSGNRSVRACDLMRRLGMEEVLHLAPGFRAWHAAGLPEE